MGFKHRLAMPHDRGVSAIATCVMSKRAQADVRSLVMVRYFLLLVELYVTCVKTFGFLARRQTAFFDHDDDTSDITAG